MAASGQLGERCKSEGLNEQLQEVQDSFSRRYRSTTFAPYDERSILPALPTVVREAQKREGLRLSEARLKQFPRQILSPVGNHPVVRGIEPFQIPWDETFPNMWLSP